MTRATETKAIAALGAVGLAIAVYLTVIHYADIAPICAASGGCEKVQSSRWSEFGGVPVAVLGLIGYVGILGSLFIRGDEGRLATVGAAFTGLAFSAYLTYLELFEIHAICQWCVASALIMVAISALAARRHITAPVVLATSPAR